MIDNRARAQATMADLVANVAIPFRRVNIPADNRR
jgi:hypothetical protein